MHIKIANSDFPILLESLISMGQVARDPERSGFGVRGFRHQGTLASWIRDPRNPEGDVAAWDPRF
jgi:hypothetical protein